uniref:Uncharacterized protein n=1 Tax=Candidatus Kentrum sp. DK TaxID=2126562 RepID=A0A450RYY0_9GAMM|nr:MAG: hypothetical protein BECKDK2373C_GA0170839_100822 [Candidatus Kentron sp. DK]
MFRCFSSGTIIPVYFPHALSGPAFADHVEITHQKLVLDEIKILYQAGKLPTPPQEQGNRIITH